MDIVGKWNENDAWRVLEIAIKQHERQSPDVFCDNNMPCEVEHSRIGQYNLKYRSKESMLLALESNGGQGYCHSCFPFLSFFEFEKRKNGWKLTKEDVAVVQWGAWGQFDPRKDFPEDASALSVLVLGDDVYGVVLEGGGSGQGFRTGALSIFARIGDTFKEVFSMITDENDNGFRELDRRLDDWQSKIEILDGKTGFYDLEIRRKGMRGGKSFSETERFKFNGQKYVASSLFK